MTIKEIFDKMSEKVNDLFKMKRNVRTVDDMISLHEEAVGVFRKIYDAMDAIEEKLLGDVRPVYESYDYWRGIDFKNGKEIVIDRLPEAAIWIKYRMKVGDNEAKEYALNWLCGYLPLTINYSIFEHKEFKKEMLKKLKDIEI